MAACPISGGKFHDECLARLGVTEEVSSETTWCCPMCVQNGSAEALLAEPDLTDVPLGDDTTHSLMRATKEAWDHFPEYKLTAAFELLPVIYSKIIECEGGNHFKIHSGLRKSRTQSSQRIASID